MNSPDVIFASGITLTSQSYHNGIIFNEKKRIFMKNMQKFCSKIITNRGTFFDLIFWESFFFFCWESGSKFRLDALPSSSSATLIQ